MQLNLKNMNTKTNYTIKLPSDSIVECLICYQLIPITISGIISLGDLIQFDLLDFNVILGTSCMLMGPRLIVNTLRLF